VSGGSELVPRGLMLLPLLATALLVGVTHADSQDAPAPAGAFADLPGRRLWYVDSQGDGVPIVFLHAATGSSAVWEHQVPAVIAAGHRFIAYDRLGTGRSTLGEGVDPGTAADDLHALVEHLRLPRFHLVGTAAGGIVAIDYALSFPDRLRSLVVANSIGGVRDEEYVALGRRLRPSPQFEALPPEFRELGPSYRAAHAEGTERWTALERGSRAPGRLPSPQRGRHRVTFAMLETLRVPALLLTGDADLYTPPPVLRLFADRMRGAESIVVPEAGHSAYWEQPELFNRAVLDFVGRH
jgi:pimeloyl-ACP methyl ester carboxylesterase